MGTDVELLKQLRGSILMLVNNRHVAQQSRADHILLWRMLQDLRFSIGESELITICQDLADRGFLKYEESRDKDQHGRPTTRVSLYKLQLTPAGRDLCEGTTSNPAIYI